LVDLGINASFTLWLINVVGYLHGYNRASIISITLLSNQCTQRKKT